jgi:LVIVD repeat-containing protein
MNRQEIVKAVAIAAVALPVLLLGTPMTASQTSARQSATAQPVPSTAPVPKATCGRMDRTETGLQGQTTPDERSSGRSDRGFNCNLELVGQFQGEGAFSQDGPAFLDNCAYYATENRAGQKHAGVVVVDASDPRHPQATAYLDDTPAGRNPHETLKVNEARKLLAVAENNGPNFAVYDLSADCRHPVLKSSVTLPGSQAHMGGWAPDGKTYYVGQNNRGVGGTLPVVDVSDPSNAKLLLTWKFTGEGRPHDVNLNASGTRLYAGQPGTFGNTGSSVGPDGLVILDVSDIQARRANPQIRILGTLYWDDQGQVEQMFPFTRNGRQYVVSTDESGGAGGAGGLKAACDRGASPYGYPQIVDITDEAKPRLVSKLRLEVNDPARCRALLTDPPDTGGGTPVYNAERCNADRATNPNMLVCGFQNAGLRVFDIRDLSRPKEIAYFKPPAVRKAVLPGSGSWTQTADRTYDKISGFARFKRVPASGTRAPEMQIWFVSDGNGFQVVRFSDAFTAAHKDLFDGAGD